MKILVNKAGQLSFVGTATADRAFCKLGHAATRRASRLVPQSIPLRFAFVALRALFPERGRVADWTRSWRCRWRATIVGGPCLGTFATRPDAIAAEEHYLNQHPENWS